MKMTWGEFKKHVEECGIKDDAEIGFFEVFSPTEVNVPLVAYRPEEPNVFDVADSV